MNTVNVNAKELRAAVKILNDSGLLKEKIKTVGIKTEVLVEEFCDEVEGLYKDNDTREKIKAMTSIKDLYNNLFEQLEAATAAEEAEEKETVEPVEKEVKVKKGKKAKVEKVAPKKETAKKGIEKKIGEKKAETKVVKTKKERDKYGFGIGTRCNMIMMLAEQGKFTNADIIKKLEGKSKINPNSVYRLLPDKGFIVAKDEKNIITIKKAG